MGSQPKMHAPKEYNRIDLIAIPSGKNAFYILAAAPTLCATQPK
jgi:hypothetical protein